MSGLPAPPSADSSTAIDSLSSIRPFVIVIASPDAIARQPVRRQQGIRPGGRIVGTELIVAAAAAGEIDDAAAHVADGHVGVAARHGPGDDRHEPVVAQHPVAVDGVGLFAAGGVFLPILGGQLDQFHRRQRCGGEKSSNNSGGAAVSCHVTSSQRRSGNSSVHQNNRSGRRLHDAGLCRNPVAELARVRESRKSGDFRYDDREFSGRARTRRRSNSPM